jgi:hypothetical protein
VGSARLVNTGTARGQQTKSLQISIGYQTAYLNNGRVEKLGFLATADWLAIDVHGSAPNVLEVKLCVPFHLDDGLQRRSSSISATSG